MLEVRCDQVQGSRVQNCIHSLFHDVGLIPTVCVWVQAWLVTSFRRNDADIHASVLFDCACMHRGVDRKPDSTHASDVRMLC